MGLISSIWLSSISTSSVSRETAISGLTALCSMDGVEAAGSGDPISLPKTRLLAYIKAFCTSLVMGFGKGCSPAFEN
jgi:hypothetical protein